MIRLKVEETILSAQARWGKRITYREIQQKTGIAETTLARLRSGKIKRVDLDVLDALGNYLGCHLNDFFEYTPNDNQPESEAVDAS
jgi:DNA-binding Xre family transcriptional regulator